MRRPPISTRPYTPFPYTTRFRSRASPSRRPPAWASRSRGPSSPPSSPARSTCTAATAPGSGPARSSSCTSPWWSAADARAMSPDANRPPVERRVGVRRAGARGGVLGGAALAGDVLLAELATLLLGGAAPHAGVLVGGEGVLEARGLGLAPPLGRA